jgi:hypothetical protein
MVTFVIARERTGGCERMRENRYVVCEKMLRACMPRETREALAGGGNEVQNIAGEDERIVGANGCKQRSRDSVLTISKACAR